MKSGMTGSGIRGNGRRARKRSMPLLGAAFLPQKNPFTNQTKVRARSGAAPTSLERRRSVEVKAWKAAPTDCPYPLARATWVVLPEAMLPRPKSLFPD